MVKIGLPVPPGFTITTLACQEFLLTGQIPESLPMELESGRAVVQTDEINLSLTL